MLKDPLGKWVNLMDNFYTWHSLGQVLKWLRGKQESLALVAWTLSTS
jgi:hypothetical protein